jgi:hypothetical protein
MAGSIREFMCVPDMVEVCMAQYHEQRPFPQPRELRRQAHDAQPGIE